MYSFALAMEVGEDVIFHITPGGTASPAVQVYREAYGEAHDMRVAASESTTDEVTDGTGLGFRDNWVFQITDPDAVPSQFLMPNEAKIKSVVKVMKEKANIPGVKVWNDPIVSSRSK